MPCLWQFLSVKPELGRLFLVSSLNARVTEGRWHHPKEGGSSWCSNGMHSAVYFVKTEAREIAEKKGKRKLTDAPAEVQKLLRSSCF
jgi:hypothetical protein